MLTGNVCGQLNQQTFIAQQDVQRVKYLGCVNGVRREIALAQRRHSKVNE
jgi:hypothetical protein